MVQKVIFIVGLMIVSASSLVAGEIPFTLEKGFVVITGKAKKDQPIQAVVFTGSTFSFVSRDLIKRLKLEMSSTNDLISNVATEDALRFANIPDLIFADQRPVEVKMRTQSFDAIEKTLGHKIDVILGLDYLSDRIVQIDFQAKVLRFLDKPPFNYESPKSANSITMRMTEHLRTALGDPISMPVVEEVKLNGSAFRTLFDTGVAYPVSIAPFAAKKTSIGSVNGKDQFAKVQLKSVDLGGYELTDVPAMIKGTWEDVETRYSAVIGVGVMQNFTVTFDWKNKWVALQK